MVVEVPGTQYNNTRILVLEDYFKTLSSNFKTQFCQNLVRIWLTDIVIIKIFDLEQGFDLS